jgi:VanZ family protein
MTATPAQTEPTQANRLPAYLLLAYTVLIVYASLHPFSGWRDPGLSPLYFLDAAWPRYWTITDLTFNVAAYLPLGLLTTLVPAFRNRRWMGILAAVILGGSLSFGLESLQTLLPSRIASNLDLACNTFGATLGGVIGGLPKLRFIPTLECMPFGRMAARHNAEPGLVLIGLWLLTQLSPETFLFGTGDLRQLLELPPVVAYAAPSFFAFETGIIVCNTIAIGLIARTLLVGKDGPQATLLFFFILALLIRTLAAAILVGPLNAFAWLTPGAGLGLAFGFILLSLLLLLPPPLRIAVAGLALMAGTVLVNVTPPNPYSSMALAMWRQGHFLNFNGLTRLVASLWPFLALPLLITLGRRS